ncbi:uncharacterized protein LOC125810154 isoform X1 [Solanum verrucosum]|uniref:uncharacterized protein LOC125810154 isoform X1 n=1 Tax=Solanum verrucosum TaxID=315347 RepID=UPI0020D1EFF0|nr:uncharacterized protein LOC125810154 isoform X1 [Solanum verrucosum]XP_049345633.1 uncharacterized protein LOC125810154 isoform X1 [Solanum verrucosum]
MGEHEGWAEPSGLLPNGLLPNAEPMIRVLDLERWSRAEERTDELIVCIQPNRPSEERRNAVADYVQRLIMKCFPCQVFTFGSVPLKTYLPDGDIDLTAFSNNQTLKDTWAYQVRDMLEEEEKNENAEFRVKEVQYIQAEVKLIKCLVENIVVDISFNQLGGLCTLCFLEEVDHLINQNHLFKRSIILIKAWCYYESRLLGAHHGLISTYALETLVLYIFHMFNNSFAGPLEVLYRFLEFFSNFDWDNFCVSLWGPVPISSLPDVTAEPPRKDSGELLLSKLFLDACSSVYAVFPAGQENQGQPFMSKHFNVIDPLRVNNNLGRSVSKGNFYRIRSAFGFGAKRLARLLDCPEENVIHEVNQFFMNTWDRHGSGQRPDAPGAKLCPRLASLDDLPDSEYLRVNSGEKKVNEKSSGHDVEVEGTGSRIVSSQHGNHLAGSFSRMNDSAQSSYTESQKSYGNLSTSRGGSDQMKKEVTSSQVVRSEKSQRNLRSDQTVNDTQGKFVFSRTRSSPELTDTYGEFTSQGKNGNTPETAKMQPTPLRQDGRNWRKNQGSENLASQSGRSLNNDASSIRHFPSHQSLDAVADSNSRSNSFNQDAGLDAPNEEFSFTGGTQGMHQDEQDLVNLMASTSLHSFNGQVHLPFNWASAQLPFPISPSVLASMGYNQRNFPGLVSANFPVDPAFSNMQFPHGMISPHLNHYIPGLGLSPSSEDTIDQNSETFSSMDMNSGEVIKDIWHEPDAGSTVEFDPENGNYEAPQCDDKPHTVQSGFDFVPSSWVSSSSTRAQQKHTKEKRGPTKEEHSDDIHFQDNRMRDAYAEERLASSRFSTTAHSSSVRSKTSSESSWDGSSSKSTKSTRGRRGNKTGAAEPTTGYGKGKMMSDHISNHAEDDDQDWNSVSTLGTEMAEGGQVPQSIISMHIARHHLPEYEGAQTSGSDSIMPIAPMLIGPGSRQRMTDNSGVFAFYPTGPPVPFLTMLPVYPDASTSHFGREECFDNRDLGHNLDLSEGLDHTENLNTSHAIRGATSIEASGGHKSDILNSDFASHWQNLQYGRFCQNPRQPGPLVYPSPVMVPPAYLQGRFPWDGPGRPSSANMNLFTQLMNYGPRVLPISPLQSVSNRPPNMFQHYVDDMPRYRSGTGTYLPNPKASVRDRHAPGTRRGSYNHDRNDNYGDREGNWNANSKSRAGGRNYNRSQSEKVNSRLDRPVSSESRTDRSWSSSHRHDSFPSYQSQNGPLHANSSPSVPPNMVYGMYPLSSMNPSAASSNGPGGPPVVMFYPYDHNSTYNNSHGEQLEFGSMGPVGFSGTNEQAQPGDGSRPKGAIEEQRFHAVSGQRSSPDQPSSPHYQRKKTEKW